MVLINMGMVLINGVLHINNIHKRYNLSLSVNAFVTKHKHVYSARAKDDEWALATNPHLVLEISMLCARGECVQCWKQILLKCRNYCLAPESYCKLGKGRPGWYGPLHKSTLGHPYAIFTSVFVVFFQYCPLCRLAPFWNAIRIGNSLSQQWNHPPLPFLIICVCFRSTTCPFAPPLNTLSY